MLSLTIAEILITCCKLYWVSGVGRVCVIFGTIDSVTVKLVDSLAFMLLDVSFAQNVTL